MSWTLRPAAPDDQAAIVAVMDEWWGGRAVARLLQPLFLEHFSRTSLVAEAPDGELVGFLVGFVSGDDPRTAYVHFLGVHPDHRAGGLGRALHDAFAAAMAARGVRRVRCVTSVVNSASVAFHEAVGFRVTGTRPAVGVDGGAYVQLEREVVLPPTHPRGAATWPPGEGTRLRGDVVELRPTVIEDARGLFAALDDERVWTHLTVARPGTPDEMGHLVERARAVMFPWTVRLRAPLRGFPAGAVVGWSSYLEVSVPDARLEVGSTAYAPGVWGTGVNPDAKQLLLGYAFEDLGFGRVQLKTDVRNTRSQDAIDRLGATREGLLRQYQRRRDQSVRDTVVYSVTADEWPRVREGLTARLATANAGGG